MYYSWPYTPEGDHSIARNSLDEYSNSTEQRTSGHKDVNDAPNQK